MSALQLWDWALAAYARPAVAETCLTLQDAHGQNVCLLLWAAWARVEDPAQLETAADLARRWEAAAVAPLRQARRGLKGQAPPIPDAEREALREQVRTAELAAERVLLEGLQRIGARASTPAPTLRALTAASAAWGRSAPAPLLAALAAALG